MAITYENLVSMIDNPDPADYAKHDPDELAAAFFEAFPTLIAARQVDASVFDEFGRTNALAWEEQHGACEEWVEKVFGFISAAVNTEAGAAFFGEWERTRKDFIMEAVPRGCSKLVYYRVRNIAFLAFRDAGFYGEMPKFLKGTEGEPAGNAVAEPKPVSDFDQVAAASAGPREDVYYIVSEAQLIALMGLQRYEM